MPSRQINEFSQKETEKNLVSDQTWWELMSAILISRSPVSGRKPGESPSIVSFCPDKCSCDFTNETNQLRVVCHGHFTENLPLAQLRSDVEILKIQPTTCARDGPEGSCQIVVENHLTLGNDNKHPLCKSKSCLWEIRIN